MANEIKAKFSTATALTITLASLATQTNDTTFNGRQSEMVDNSTTRYRRIRLFVKVRVGTSPTAGRQFTVHALRGDKDAGTPHRTDNAGASDAALIVENAEVLDTSYVNATTSDKDHYKEIIFENPGPEWGIHI